MNGCLVGRTKPMQQKYDMMGCTHARPDSRYSRDSLDSDSGEESYTRDPADPRVHWETDTDWQTEYTSASRVQSSYGSRLMSARGGRARIGSATTGMSEIMNESMASDSDLDLLTDDGEEETPGTRAPSLSFWYNDNEVGDILTQDIYVPAYGLCKHTYYCALQWNAGMNGGGYLGIQDHPAGRNYIFSLWDPIGTKEKIKPVYVGPGTMCEKFGGEGEGLKTWNFTLGWEPDCWYTLVTRRWDHGDHTYFGFWVQYQMELEWTHIATIDYPVADVYFETLSCSFLEDWEGNGECIRRVHYKSGYKHGLTGSWMPFKQAAFSVVKEMSSKTYEHNYNAGVLDDTFFLQSGAETLQTENAEDGMTLIRSMPSKPDMLPLCCYVTSVTDDEMTWEIASGSVPQFQYIIYVDRCIYKQDINTEVRMCRFRSPPKENVVLLVEDIYGKTVRSEFSIQKVEVREKLRIRCDVYIPSASA